jgi:hypothetical protein
MKRFILKNLPYRFSIAGLVVSAAVVLALGAYGTANTPVARAATTASFTDPHWSGYAATGKTYTKASAEFYVPRTSCTASNPGYADFWVGLDGWGSYDNQTVEQVGVEASCSGSTPKFTAWSEMWPQEGTTVAFKGVTLHAGDLISAYTMWSPTTHFTVSLTDMSTNVNVHRSASVAGATRGTAEWVAERPCYTGNCNYPLLSWAPGHTFGFYDVEAATGANGSGLQNATAYDLAKINMYANGHYLTTTGAISNDVNGHNQFGVTFNAAK